MGRTNVSAVKKNIERLHLHPSPTHSSFFSSSFFVQPSLISCYRAPRDRRAATQSPGARRQASILGDGSVFPWWQACPLRAGRRCLSGSIWIGCNAQVLMARGMRSMKQCLLVSCLSVSGCQDKSCVRASVCLSVCLMGVFYLYKSGLLHFKIIF